MKEGTREELRKAVELFRSPSTLELGAAVLRPIADDVEALLDEFGEWKRLVDEKPEQREPVFLWRSIGGIYDVGWLAGDLLVSAYVREGMRTFEGIWWRPAAAPPAAEGAELEERTRGPEKRKGITAEEFERRYAEQSGMTVEELRALGRIVEPCDCGPNCAGWRSIGRSDAQPKSDAEG